MDIFVFCINIQGGHKDSGRVRLDLRDLCEDFDWGNSSDCRNESRFSVPLRCIGEDVRCWMCSCQPCGLLLASAIAWDYFVNLSLLAAALHLLLGCGLAQ